MVQAVESQASILVVDDNPLIVNVLRGLFGAQEYRVYCCNNGQEALDVLDRKSVDVIICDVMMPKMDGYELHNVVREKPELSHIPFVFLTALGDEYEVCKGKEVGADDYVVKPFDPRQLLSMIKGKIVRSRKLKNLSREQYDGFRKRIIHTLSHEFRTPLVAINTGTELLLGRDDSFESEKVQNLLAAIQRGGLRLERLVNDFMLMQQIEAGVAQKLFATRAETIDIQDLLGQYLQAKQRELSTHGFELIIVNQLGSMSVHVYEPQIVDILNRFIDNAMKFSLEEKVIEVCVTSQGDRASIEVRDRGMGMDVDRVREAIDVFGQIDRDKLEQQGGGLGLAIANRYASINGGGIEFENRPGGGSAVALTLPKVGSSSC